MVEATQFAVSDYSKTKKVLKGAQEGQVVTRFPPEPSGYLHIGHVKAAMMNYHYSRMYGGKMILRFDDTNPMNEKVEFVDNIIRDLKTLGITADQVTYSSDHFEMLQGYMRQMIQEEKAYADNLPAEEMKEQRDNGIESAARAHTVAKNLELFEGMLKGGNKDYCIRAKLNMQDKVKCLRDPVFYRTKDIPHHRTGDKFKAYPTYDFTCPIVDSFEGVTHALRTIEYRDRNSLYAWVQSTLNLRPVEIYDFSKLNLLSTCLSKRKLRWFVENGKVEGWNDPRFPTIQGIQRRGMTSEALKTFMLEQGPSRNTVNMEWDKIWAVNKQILDPVAPRYTCINKATAIKLTIENGPATPEARTQELHPKNASVGQKAVMYGRDLIIELADAKTIEVGQRVTLMKWGNATITRRQDNGDSFELFATIDEADKDFKKTTKITWICNDPATTCEIKMVEFDHLITKDKVEETDDNEDIFNKNSRFEDVGIAEGIVKSLPAGSYLQFERRGFYMVDKIAMVNSQLVVHFVPDGKTKGMSVIGHTVDAAETAKGKGNAKGGKDGKEKGTGAPDGKLSKKDLKKLEKKAGKAAGVKVDDKKGKKGGKEEKKGGDKKPSAAKSSQSDCFSGPAADKWESMLAQNQYFGGQKPSQADAQALKHMTGRLPDPEAHPNLFGWAAITRKFKDDVMAKWPKGELEIPAGAGAGAAAGAPTCASKFFSGSCANMWEQLLTLSGAQYLLGEKPTQADSAAIKEMGALRPNAATHPNLFAWSAIVTKFKDTVQSKWATGDLPRPATVAVKEKAAQPTKAAAAADDVDEDDLFGDDPAADAQVAALSALKKAAKDAKPKKAAPTAKSIVLLEVKPLDDETDLDLMASKILGYAKDGLVWKQETKKEPVAYGIFKLIVGLVIEDEKVSIDNDIIPMIEEMEDLVQSVDILSFNKL